MLGVTCNYSCLINSFPQYALFQIILDNVVSSFTFLCKFKRYFQSLLTKVLIRKLIDGTT
jgi:hypothetical protein